MSTNSSLEAHSSNTQYIHRALYVLIKIAGSKNWMQHGKTPIEQTLQVDISDILSTNKRPRLRSNKKAILSVKRRSLPLVPAYCITTHKSQGQTLRTDDIAAVYVPLSRVKHLADLVLVRYFDYKVFLIKPSKSQVAQVERLEKLYSETQIRWDDWFWCFLSVIQSYAQRCRLVALPYS